MSSQLKARIALQGDTKDLMNKLQQTKAKAKETSAQIHQGFSKTTGPLDQMSALLGGNNDALNSMSNSVSGVGSQMAKLATANPILISMTALVAAAKLAYDELKRSVEDYTQHTAAGMDSINAHNKALEEAISFTRRIKEERSGLGQLAEEARQDVEVASEIYKSGSTFWQKAMDFVLLSANQYGSVVSRVSERGLNESFQVYDKVKAAQSELIGNEREWYKYGKLRVENLRTEARELLILVNDKKLSDNERLEASRKYKDKMSEAFRIEQVYLKERARLIKVSNEDSDDSVDVAQMLLAVQTDVNNSVNAYSERKREIMGVENEILARLEGVSKKVHEQLSDYYTIEGISKRLDETERSRLDTLMAQNKTIEDAWKLVDGFDWGDEDASDMAVFDLADTVRTDSDKLRTKAEEMTALMNQYINEVFAEGISGTIENGIAAAFNPDLSFMDASMTMLADFSTTFGKMMIAHGTATEAFRKSLENFLGIPSIAAGIALVASGALIKGFLNKKSKSFNDGGVFNAHYGDQLVARLNPSEMVLTTQQQANLFNMLKMGSNPYQSSEGLGEVVFRIGNDELVGTLKKGAFRKFRNG